MAGKWERLLSMAACGAALLSAQGTNPGELSRRSLELYRQGKCGEATPLFEQILLRQAGNFAVRKLYASCLAKSGKTAEAREQYKLVLKDSPGDREALQYLAPPKAAATPAPKPAAPPPTERARTGGTLDEAEKLIKANRLDDAEKLLAGLVQRMPDLVLPRQRLAEIYSATKRYELAGQMYQELAKLQENQPVFRLREAQNFAWAEQYREAAEAYQAYLASNNLDVDGRLGLANVLFWSNRLPEAADAYKAYLLLRPEDLDARFNLANALMWSKNYDGALDEYKKVAAKRSKDPNVELALAQCYEQLEKPELALASYERILAQNPEHVVAKQSRERLLSFQLEQRAFALVEKKDYPAAAKLFLEYLDRHPEKDETLLQIARVYAWAKRYGDSSRFYRSYLERHPADETALRELGKVALTIPDFPAAREQYAALVKTANAKAEDYEGLINAFVWDGKPEGAQGYAKRLLEIDGNNIVAYNAMKEASRKEKNEILAKAQKLVVANRFEEAMDTYRDYAARYGADREAELAICRIYAWNKQPARAIQAFEEYLQRYPSDQAARVEMANLHLWSGSYSGAEKEYQTILEANAKQPQALLGMAQISDYRGVNRFEVARQYRRVLEPDPSNETARERLRDMIPLVSPSLQVRELIFTDSDDYGRSMTTVEGSIPMAGGLRVTPFFRSGYFSQQRQVGGALCGTKAPVTDARYTSLTEAICSGDGSLRGNGGGVRLDLFPGGKVSATLEGSALNFSELNRTSANAQADLVFHPQPTNTITLSYIRRDATYDVNTVASLFAGVMSDTVLVSYGQPIGNRWRFWASAGAARYTESRDRQFGRTTQKRLGVRLDYKVLPSMTAGYFMRLSAFNDRSPLYFSPKFYGTYGVTYGWHTSIARTVQAVGDMEVGYGRIDRYDIPGVNVLEISAFPSIEWRARPDIFLRIGYRYSRGRSSVFGSPVYTTNALELNINGYFAQPLPPVRPNRLEVR